MPIDEYAIKIDTILQWAEQHKDQFEYHHYIIIPFNPDYVKGLMGKQLTPHEMNMLDAILTKLNIIL